MYIPAAVNHTAILIQLRALMVANNLNLDAYIVPAGDAHYSEFTAECFLRRAFISGFTGSAGTAIVARSEALLWTDGRYFLQAENQLDSELWTLMKDGQPGVPSQYKWLVDNLPNGGRVGVDPTLYSKGQWDRMQQELQSGGKELVSVSQNLVDQVWGDGRPKCASDPIINLGLAFAGKPSSTKVEEVRQEMKQNSASLLLLTELDEVAWLLNLRGKDIPFSSTFFAYVLMTEGEFHLFVNTEQLTAEVNQTITENIAGIEIHKYETVVEVLREKVGSIAGNVWCNQNTNYALVSLIPQERQIVKLTPISLMKAVKNPTEVIGYKNALIRDSAAISEFLAWLEEEIRKGTRITEISASEKLHSIREERENFFDDSFNTISAAGENGAIIHYMPTAETDRVIGADDMYLLDSGGLYYDGTTDITRTIHLGTPSPHQKDSYTRVLKGQMSITRAVFPSRMVGSRLDSFARQFLWEVGLDYNHGTGHGVGSFLNVHEGPFSIGGYSSADPGFRENFFTSNEPGYYEDGAFGIRLENIVRVKNASLDHNFQNRGFIGFEDVTFVPYQHKLIDFTLLTEEELDYLNDYQRSIRRLVGGYMQRNSMSDSAYEWLMKATVPVNENGPVEGGDEDESSSSTPPPSTTASANGLSLNFITGLLPLYTIVVAYRTKRA